MTQDINDRDDGAGNDRAHSVLDKTLLDVLVCPITRGPLEYDQANNELISRQAGKAFPIKQGVPIMLVDQARTIDLAKE